MPEGGARLPLLKAYRYIKGVNITLQQTGSDDADRVVIVDKNETLGPLIEGEKWNGSAWVSAAALVDAVVMGAME